MARDTMYIKCIKVAASASFEARMPIMSLINASLAVRHDICRRLYRENDSKGGVDLGETVEAARTACV